MNAQAQGFEPSESLAANKREFGEFGGVNASPKRSWKRQVTNTTLLTDIGVASQYMGQLSPYQDNNYAYFGVQDVGLPDGCQIEQAHSLQRHAQRFPTGSFDDGTNDENFAAKVYNFTIANPESMFTGPLAFLNT